MISVSSNFITFIKGILDWIVLVLFLYLNFGYDENMRGDDTLADFKQPTVV